MRASPSSRGYNCCNCHVFHTPISSCAHTAPHHTTRILLVCEFSVSQAQTNCTKLITKRIIVIWDQMMFFPFWPDRCGLWFLPEEDRLLASRRNLSPDTECWTITTKFHRVMVQGSSNISLHISSIISVTKVHILGLISKSDDGDHGSDARSPLSLQRLETAQSPTTNKHRKNMLAEQKWRSA